MNTQFTGKLEEYVHLNYHERIKKNEELFSIAKSADELMTLYNLFDQFGVHTYEEKILEKMKDVAKSKEEWMFLKIHSYNYLHINKLAENELKKIENQEP